MNNSQNTQQIHDFNHSLKNILTGIQAYGQLIKRRLIKGDLETATELSDKLNGQIERLSTTLIEYLNEVKKITDSK